MAIAVGLLVLAGAITMYGATKDAAASSTARERVSKANTFIAEYASVNSGMYPTSSPGGGSFTAMWIRKMPDDYNASPWGGFTGDVAHGVTEITPFSNGTASPVGAPNHTPDLTADTTRAANLIYVSVTGNKYVQIQQFSNATAENVKGYTVSIYDRTGNPWYHLAYGN